MNSIEMIPTDPGSFPSPDVLFTRTEEFHGDWSLVLRETGVTPARVPETLAQEVRVVEGDVARMEAQQEKERVDSFFMSPRRHEGWAGEELLDNTRLLAEWNLGTAGE